MRDYSAKDSSDNLSQESDLPELSAAQRAELDRRLAEYDKDPTAAISGDGIELWSSIRFAEGRNSPLPSLMPFPRRLGDDRCEWRALQDLRPASRSGRFRGSSRIGLLRVPRRGRQSGPRA